MYTGGTLAAEAAGLLAGHLGVEADDTHQHGMMLDADSHQIIDLGDDFYTVGRPHPMIDPTLRNQLIADLGAKPQVYCACKHSARSVFHRLLAGAGEPGYGR
nr:hypothetical protein [Escherichia coli]